MCRSIFQRLLQAFLISTKVARNGFDWETEGDVWEKFDEELKEFHQAQTQESKEEEFGDLLFTLVNVARKNEINPEDALRDANRKFRNRFDHLEDHAREQNKEVKELSPAELDSIWEQVKNEIYKMSFPKFHFSFLILEMRKFRIIVFIKQVPDVGEMHFSGNQTFVRDGVKNIINPYDRRAISEAIRNRENFGGEVIVATMGPLQAREALAETLVMGADRAIHIEDRRLAGSDTLVTAKVLAAAARKIGFDLIFAGQHSTDSETGQVPPSIAEILQIPWQQQLPNWNIEKNLIATSETDDGTWNLGTPLSCGNFIR